MQNQLLVRRLVWPVLSLCLGLSGRAQASFTRLEPVAPPKITGASAAYPGGAHEAANLIDGKPATEYSSDSKGTNTFVEFDFGSPTSLSAFRHVDRNDPATIRESELALFDDSGREVFHGKLKHPNKRSGVATITFPVGIQVRRARWSITQVGSQYNTVGGAEITFLRPGKVEPAPSAASIHSRPDLVVERSGDRASQNLNLDIDWPYAEAVSAELLVPGAEPLPVQLAFGAQAFRVSIPALAKPKKGKIMLRSAGETLLSVKTVFQPVRPLDIYLLPHSHVDIGYTALQPDIEKKQNDNLETGLRLARDTAGFPEGARFKWNAEVLWPIHNYLTTAPEEKRKALIAAIKSGQVGLDAFFGNILTGLCRPEELIQLMRYATELNDLCGVRVESAMISDVPGYTWSTVSAMAQAGVKYFSFAPNYFDRMGGTMKEWQNRPFWWQGPDGKQRVLCWCPSRGYALGHLIGDGEALARFIPQYVAELQATKYPYEITHLRWNVHGDNGSPDEKLAQVVRDWNAKYASPRLIIATTAEAFRKFEERYGRKLPVFSGDYTPYWEDGAASSARETSLNRASAERLVQAEAIWAMRQPAPFPAAEFETAWRNILLYSEHTWGAHNSISQPDLPFVLGQWKIKQGFALDADKQSRALLEQALAPEGDFSTAGALDVFNTCSWERTDLVTVPSELSPGRDAVIDEHGDPVPSQRLSSGELAFLAKVPGFCAKRFRVVQGAPAQLEAVYATGSVLAHPDLTVRIDEQSGAIKSLYSKSLCRELVNAQAETALNDFFYLPGSNLQDLQRNGASRIKVKEQGPLVASVVVESDAPGCKSLTREIRVIAGLDRVEIINTIDKTAIRAKEGIHFGYGFAVPEGEVRMDVGWASVRPEKDQIPAACKNWFSVQRWVDISNPKFGVTWVPVDAPLVQVGGITANLVGSQTDPSVWRQHIEPSQTLYSWVMNNHWHTNYRAEQDGPTVFRFAIRPHGHEVAIEAARFGASCSQPLLVTRAAGPIMSRPRLSLSSDAVVAAVLKPADKGPGYVLRLFGASGKPEKVELRWAEPQPHKMWLSGTSEKPLQPITGPVKVPAWGVVTVLAE